MIQDRDHDSQSGERFCSRQEFQALLEANGAWEDYKSCGIGFITDGKTIFSSPNAGEKLAIYRLPHCSLVEVLSGIDALCGEELSRRHALTRPALLKIVYEAFLNGVLCLYNDLDQLSTLFHHLGKREFSAVPAAGAGRPWSVLHIGGAGHKALLENLLKLLPESARVDVSWHYDSRWAHEGARPFHPFLVERAREILDSVAVIDNDVQVQAPQLIELFGEFAAQAWHHIEQHARIGELQSIEFAERNGFNPRLAKHGVELSRPGKPVYLKRALTAARNENLIDLCRSFQLAFLRYCLQLESVLLWNLPLETLKDAAAEKKKDAEKGSYLSAWNAVLRVADDAVLAECLNAVGYLRSHPEVRAFMSDRSIWQGGMPGPFEYEDFARSDYWRGFLRDREVLFPPDFMG